ncbi:MAG TPA: hypothetical protein VGZ26_03810 [Pirellulales bacterium]|nr:hypothetical protein [Pirellulales bacterium]
MATLNSLRRILGIATLWVSMFSISPLASYGAQVVFDLPDTIECRDVTPPEFSAGHPSLKVIEAKFRITARIKDGSSSDIVDFLYVLTSTDKTMRLQDYLPNTTLESAVADDRIEITNATEKALSGGLDAHVVYKPLLLGGTINQGSKKSESSHYQQIAAKELVLASGTTNREHGVFFRLRPSRAASLEGAKEFTFLATVPKTWRGDLCTVSCSARAKKSSLLSMSVVSAGADQTQIGMYLAADAEAAALAEALRSVQESRAAALAAPPAKLGAFETISLQTAGLFTGNKSAAQARKKLKDADKAVLDVETRLKQLAR